MTLLSLSGLTARRGARAVVADATMTVAAGEFVGLIGPNGAGKTTLMRAALGLIPAQGASNLAAMGHRDRARQAAWMPQDREIAWAVDVETLVRLGRIPRQDRRAADAAAVQDAMARMGVTALRHRPVTELSGGEQARVLIARALAQDTPLLVADEPIAGLDPAAQIGVMRLFRKIAGQGRSVLASLHDLGLAARHCTRLVLLHQGRIAADGPPDQVLSAENLARVFGITAYFSQKPEGLLFQPLDTIGGGI